MQRLNAREPWQKDLLQAERYVEENTHLRFSRKVFKNQLDAENHAGLEQPKHAESWNTSTFKSMDSLWHKTQVDQCALGTMLPDSDGTYLPVKKPPHWHCQVHYWLRHFMQYVLVVNDIFLWKDLLQALEAALQLLPRTSQVCVNSWRRTSTTS